MTAMARWRGCARRLGRWCTPTWSPVTTRVCEPSQGNGGTALLDLTNAPEGFLDPVARVVEAALAVTAELSALEVMLVGPCYRDILHGALGHSFATAATRDLDLALALTCWDAYRPLAGAFPRIGDTGIRFRIADVNVDLVPLGEIEDPQGGVEPQSRRETLSVWAFEEIFAASLPLVLSPTCLLYTSP